MLFFLQDSKGNFGGASHILSVGTSDDGSSDCIDSQSPHSTASLGHGEPSEITSTSSATALPSLTSNSPHKTGPPVSPSIIGVVVAVSTIALIIAGVVLYFFCKRKPIKQRNRGSLHQAIPDRRPPEMPRAFNEIRISPSMAQDSMVLASSQVSTASSSTPKWPPAIGAQLPLSQSSRRTPLPIIQHTDSEDQMIEMPPRYCDCPPVIV